MPTAGFTQVVVCSTSPQQVEVRSLHIDLVEIELKLSVGNVWFVGSPRCRAYTELVH